MGVVGRQRRLRRLSPPFSPDCVKLADLMRGSDLVEDRDFIDRVPDSSEFAKPCMIKPCMIGFGSCLVSENPIR